jgi:carboxylesterase
MKSIFKRFRNKNKAILIVHGYSKRRWHALDPLIAYLDAEGYTLFYPPVYNNLDGNDCNAHEWVQRMIIEAQNISKRFDKFYIIGFSMGGVIASAVAAAVKVNRLILLAPAFEYITFENLKNKVKNSLLPKTIETDTDYPPIPLPFERTFKDVVKDFKNSIQFVSCPLLIIHGSKDSRIPLSSSHYAYEKTCSFHKQLIVLEGVNHNLVEDVTYNTQIFSLIQSFIEKTLTD